MRRLFVIATIFATSGCAAGVYNDAAPQPQANVRTDQIIVTGYGVQRNVDCTGRDVVVDGDGLQATLNGTCPTVTISGHGNQVAAGVVGTIAVSGSGNTVHWVASQAGSQPVVKDTGAGNTIIQQSGASTTDTGKADPLPTTQDTAPVDGNNISGKWITRTVACDGRDVVVTAIQSTITLTGECGTVDVRGVQAKVEVASTKKVVVSGLQCTVTIGRTEWISVTGMQDVVRYQQGNPKIDNTGSDSTVRRLS